MRSALACEKCGAAAGRACKTKSGNVTDDHKGRGYVEDDAPPKATPNPARVHVKLSEDDEPFEPPSEIQIVLEDAGRVARQRTFGTVDDTLDPVEICAQISRFANEMFSSDDIWSQEQVDEAVGAVEAERDEARKERDAAFADLESVRAELAEVRALESDACRCGDPIERGQGTCGALECGGRALDGAHDRMRAELEYARSELELERERGRKLETFLESTKSQLRAIIEGI